MKKIWLKVRSFKPSEIPEQKYIEISSKILIKSTEDVFYTKTQKHYAFFINQIKAGCSKGIAQKGKPNLQNLNESTQPIEIPKIPISDVQNNKTFDTAQTIVNMQTEPATNSFVKPPALGENNIYLKSILSNQVLFFI